MGKRQAGKLSSMIVSNYFVGFPSEKQTDNLYQEMLSYLEKKGIEIINDGSEVEKGLTSSNAGNSSVRSKQDRY